MVLVSRPIFVSWSVMLTADVAVFLAAESSSFTRLPWGSSRHQQQPSAAVLVDGTEGWREGGKGTACADSCQICRPAAVLVDGTRGKGINRKRQEAISSSVLIVTGTGNCDGGRCVLA